MTHFLSTATYLLYIVLFQQMCFDFPNWRDDLLKNRSQSENNISVLAQSRKMIVFFGFVFIHLSILGLTLIIHSVSKKYEMQLFPFDYRDNGWVVFGYYSIYWVLIVACSLSYLIFLWRQPNVPQVQANSVSEQESLKQGV